MGDHVDPPEATQSGEGDESAAVAGPEESAHTSRRRLLLGALGAAAAGAAGSALIPSAADAATGDNMILGEFNSATSITSLAPAPFIALDSSSFFGAIEGTNFFGPGVLGTSTFAGAGVQGLSFLGPGLVGRGSTYGVQATGDSAPLFLTPGTIPGPPSSGSHSAGEVFVGSAGTFFRCVLGGTPGVWVPMYSVVPLATPLRVINSTNGTGGVTGPFNPDGATHTTGVLTNGTTIPTEAVALVGNLAISGNGATLNGNGFLTLFPAGTANPGTSSLNCGGDAFSTANGVTIGLGTGGNAGKLSFSWQGGGGPLPCQVFFDVNAYIL